MATRVVTVNDVLDGHVGLDLECFDRIYFNGWVPTLQMPGQVVSFLTQHLGFPSPSAALLERIGLGFARRWRSSPPRVAFRWSASSRGSASWR
jgi:hypothetical protein